MKCAALTPLPLVEFRLATSYCGMRSQACTRRGTNTKCCFLGVAKCRILSEDTHSFSGKLQNHFWPYLHCVHSAEFYKQLLHSLFYCNTGRLSLGLLGRCQSVPSHSGCLGRLSKQYRHGEGYEM